MSKKNMYTQKYILAGQKSIPIDYVRNNGAKLANLHDDLIKIKKFDDLDLQEYESYYLFPNDVLFYWFRLHKKPIDIKAFKLGIPIADQRQLDSNKQIFDNNFRQGLDNVNIKNNLITKFNIDLSITDTIESLKYRIAAAEKVPIEYIYYQDNDGDYTSLRQELAPINTIKELQKRINDFKKYKLENKQIVFLWLKMKNIAIRDLDINDIIFFDPQLYTLDILKPQFAEFNTQFNAKLDIVNKQAKNYNELINVYSKYDKDNVHVTQFIQTEYDTIYNFTINVDMLELFNALETSPNLQFIKIVYNNTDYYKFVNHLVPTKEMISALPEYIKYVNVQPNDTMIMSFNMYDKEYAFYLQYHNFDNEANVYNASIRIFAQVQKVYDLSNISETFFNIIISHIKNDAIKIEKTSHIENGIRGDFAMTGCDIDRNIMLELITNDPKFSTFMYTSEVAESSSLKNVFHMYYSTIDDVEENELTMYISKDVTLRNNAFYVQKLLKINVPYTNVHISRAVNLDQIKKFAAFFRVFCEMYLDNKDKVINEYSKIIPNFMAVEETNTEGANIKNLQIADPNLFITNYSIKCAQQKQPMAISEAEIEEWEQQGYSAMQYPKESKNWYICPHDEFSYPGLLKNELDNKDEYPMLPCCYKNDQTAKPSSGLYKYMNDQSLEKNETSGNIITRKAIFSSEKEGYVARNPVLIFQRIFGPEIVVRRIGNPKSNHSFLTAVLYALNYSNYQTLQDKLEFEKSILNKLSTDLTSGSQQLYDDNYSVKLLQSDTILDSKYYVKVLENLLKCQIIVFSTVHDLNGTFELPNYNKGYVYNKWVPNIDTIFIYKHHGIRGDNLVNPHYEVLSVQVGKTKPAMVFKNNVKLITVLTKYFNMIYSLYMTTKGQYIPLSLPISTLPTPKIQLIDKYGKVQGYIYENDIVLIISPTSVIPNIQTTTELPKKLATFESTLKFIKKHQLVVKSFNIIGENMCNSINIDCPGLLYSYVLFDQTIIDKTDRPIVKNTNIYFQDNTLNELDLLGKMKQTASFLMQLIQYSFSIWSKDNDSIDTDLFYKNNTMIDAKMNYNLECPRRLGFDLPFFRARKLVLNSPELESKLHKFLNSQAKKSITDLVNYANNNQYLQDYYIKPSDFNTKYGTVHIGQESMYNWIKNIELTKNNVASKSIPDPKFEAPFYFINYKINNNNPIIIQNVQNGDMMAALYVAKIFKKHNFNAGFYAKKIKNPPEFNTITVFDNELYANTMEHEYTLLHYGQDKYAAILMLNY